VAEVQCRWVQIFEGDGAKDQHGRYQEIGRILLDPRHDVRSQTVDGPEDDEDQNGAQLGAHRGEDAVDVEPEASADDGQDQGVEDLK